MILTTRIDYCCWFQTRSQHNKRYRISHRSGFARFNESSMLPPFQTIASSGEEEI